MRELSLHIMDIIENGLAAGANVIRVFIVEDRQKNWLRITITDNGCGMPEEILKKVMDPFFTTRTTRRIGLGLSLFREASRRCDGELNIKSKPSEGTEVVATFRLDHIDLPPFGDMSASMTSLIMGNPDVDFIYTHERNRNHFQMDTRQIKEELDGVPINHPEVLKYIDGTIKESLEELKKGNIK